MESVVLLHRGYSPFVLQHSPGLRSPPVSPSSSFALSWVLDSRPRFASLRLSSLLPAQFSPNQAVIPFPERAPDELQEARSVLGLVLSETGLSNDDARLIASSAPACVQSLIDAAHELDEFASWSSDLPAVHANFREKVYELAKASRGRQIGAFIESVGIEQRHISRICHILASQELPDLLEKVFLFSHKFLN